MIWKRLPTNVSVGADLLQLGVYDAAANFNIGSPALLKVLKEIGMEPGKYFVEAIHEAD